MAICSATKTEVKDKRQIPEGRVVTIGGHGHHQGQQQAQPAQHFTQRQYLKQSRIPAATAAPEEQQEVSSLVFSHCKCSGGLSS